MATLSKGYTFGSSETVTNTKLHNLVDLGAVTGIVNADILSGAAIAESKVNFDGSTVVTIGTTQTITGAKTFSGAITFSGTVSGIGFVDRGDPAAFDFTVGDLTTDGTWRDLDLSAIVPAGAKAVLFNVGIRDNLVEQIFYLRKNGSAIVFSSSTIKTQVANIGFYVDLIVACDSNRVIEYLAANTAWTTINLTVRGWWL